MVKKCIRVFLWVCILQVVNIDDGDNVPIYYTDIDLDGFGDPESGIASCNPIGEYILDNTDCDDNNDQVHPSAIELCNNIDDKSSTFISKSLNFLVIE